MSSQDIPLPHPRDEQGPPRPTLRFMLSSPWHVIALGAGSGLAPFASGTFGTLAAWGAFVLLDRWLSNTGWALLIMATLFFGAWAAQRTGERLAVADSGHVVIDEIVAFWIVLLLLPDEPRPGWLAAAAFVLFRLFDIAKPPPIRWLDARYKNGVGVMLDDLVAAFFTLLVIALGWQFGTGSP